MLSRLTIAQKVYLLGFTQLLTMVIMGVFALSQMNKIGHELSDIAEKDIPLTKMLTSVTEHQLHQAILFERALIKAIRVEQGLSQMNVFEQAKQDVHDLTVKTAKEIVEVERFMEQAMPLLYSLEAKEKFKRLLGKMKSVEKSYSNLVGEVDKTMDYGSSGNIEEMLKFSKKVEAHEDEIDQALIAILDEVQSFTLASALQAEADEKHAIKWMTVIALVSISLGIIMPLIVTRAIRTPIMNLTDRLKQVAEGDGDLTIRLDDSSRDETGTVANAFNTFLGVLMGTITQINAKAEELGKSSEVAVSAMQRTLENVEKQRCDIEQVATAINQMNATTQEVANSTANASSVTDAVRKHVMEGQKKRSRLKKLSKS